MDLNKDFEKFAKSIGVSTHTFDDVKKSINNALTPVILEERKLQTTPVDVFSRLLFDRQIYFGSHFTADACNVVVAELLYLSSLEDRDISIIINSEGGSVIDGLAVIDTMNYIPCDVSTFCVGMAASMGAVLLTSGTHGKRYILPHSRVMIHQVSSYTSGTYSDMKIELEETERCRRDIYDILARTTGKSFEEIEKLCDRNNWLHGHEVLEVGLADNILVKKG